MQRTFGLIRSFQHPLLEELLQATHEPSERHRITLEELRQELLYTIDTLNEEELKVYFIGPLLRLIPFRSGDRRLFLDRPMSFTYGNEQETNGKINWMLADGIQDPRQPYFFIHGRRHLSHLQYPGANQTASGFGGGRLVGSILSRPTDNFCAIDRKSRRRVVVSEQRLVDAVSGLLFPNDGLLTVSAAYRFRTTPS